MDTLASYTVDLRSDTITKPTASMRQAMTNASVGDDVYGEDPTVNTLERKVALLLGKQAALYVPSGTMANLISVMVHCDKRGAEVIVGDKSHILKNEQCGVAQFGSVIMTPIKNKSDGTFDLDELRNCIRGEEPQDLKTSLIIVENTHNACGGTVLPLDWITKLSTLAKERSVMLHMDGARLFNAAQYLGVEPSEIVKYFDTASICFSKGLGAPVGSCIVGSFSFIRQARKVRRALGGGMRQAGILAAAAIVALDEMVPALGGDHRRANFLANAISALRSPTFTVNLQNVQTNMVLVEIDEKLNLTADKVVERLKIITENELKQGCVTEVGEGIIVKIIKKSNKHLRITTYYEISDEDINYAIKKLSFVFKEMEYKKGFFS